LGIVNKVTPHEELMDTTLELAKRIGDGATYSMALIKRLVQRSLYVDFAESLRLAGPAQAIARRTEDHKEGVRAFVEKRRPSFVGR
jgi:2-(1,2-epoxy-1,2-dihydrophenyl)acetyl-CoA isomerase